jgi:hypothetical protein
MESFIRSTRRSFLVLLLMAAIPLPLASQGRRPGLGPSPAQAEALRQAGQRLGIQVETNRMAYFGQEGATFFTAPAATPREDEQRRGLIVAVAYVDLSGQRFPAGYYGVRVFPDSQQVGTRVGRVQLIGSDGRVAAEIPTTMEVRSGPPPAQAASRTASVMLGVDSRGNCFGVKWCFLRNGVWVCNMACWFFTESPD